MLFIDACLHQAAHQKAQQTSHLYNCSVNRRLLTWGITRVGQGSPIWASHGTIFRIASKTLQQSLLFIFQQSLHVALATEDCKLALESNASTCKNMTFQPSYLTKWRGNEMLSKLDLMKVGHNSKHLQFVSNWHIIPVLNDLEGDGVPVSMCGSLTSLGRIVHWKLKVPFLIEDRVPQNRNYSLNRRSAIDIRGFWSSCRFSWGFHVQSLLCRCLVCQYLLGLQSSG